MPKSFGKFIILFQNGMAIKAKGLIDFIKFLFSATLKSLKKDSKLTSDKYDFVFFSNDSDKNLIRSGLRFSPIMDSLQFELELQGKKILHVALPFSAITETKAWSKSKRINRLMLIYLYKSFIYKRLPIFKSSYPKSPYQIIFDKAKPIAVFAIGAPAQLCIDCRAANIKIVEVSHAIGLKSLIEWGWESLRNEELPNVVLSFDSISTSTFKTHSEKVGQPYIVCETMHPFLKLFLLPQFKHLLPLEWIIDEKGNQNIKQILISLSWGYSGDTISPNYSDLNGILSNGLFPESILEIIQNTKNKILWRFRFHPVQLSDNKYSKQIRFIKNICSKFTNTEWEDSSHLPLPTLLKCCDGHISMMSMTSYEAAYFGVPSLLLCPSLKKGGRRENYFSDLQDSGFVTKGEMDKEYIVNWVSSVSKIESLAMCNNSKIEIGDIFDEITANS